MHIGSGLNTVSSLYGQQKGNHMKTPASGEKTFYTAETPKVYQIFTTDNMLWTGGNGTGLSYCLKYADDSTDENPVVLAKGVDENGKEFEQRIYINDVNPSNATVVEMRALEAHYKVEKQGGFTSLSLEAGNMGLNDRRDFISMFKKSIEDLNKLGRSYYKMEVSNNYSTAKLWGTLDKKVSKSSEKNKWKLTDSLKEKIVELAKKDAQDNVYMGNAFMNLRKMEVSKVAPNRAALIGKFNQSMNSGNMSAMKEVEKADKKWLCILFGIPYEAEFQGEGTGSAAHVYNECGEEVLTYTEGVGWQEKETKAESQVHSALKSTYYEAFCDARKALNSEQRTGGMNENIMSQGNFDMKA